MPKRVPGIGHFISDAIERLLIFTVAVVAVAWCFAILGGLVTAVVLGIKAVLS